MTRRVPKRPSPGVLAWTRVLRAATQRARLQVAEADLLRLAALLSLVAAPTDPDGQAAFYALQDLLLRPRSTPDRKHGRVGRLPAALDAIPPEREAVLHLVAAVRAWREVAGRPPTRDFPLDRVVRCILEVPDPEAYVRHLYGRGMTSFAGMFHPNTIERARKELRGVFGRYEGENEYWAEVKDHVRTVE